MEWALSPPSHWEVVLSLLPRLFLHCDEQHRLLLLLRPNPVINIDGRRYRGVIWFLLSFRTALGVSVRLLSQLLLLCYYRVDFSAPFGGAALDEQRNWIEWTDKTEHQMPLFFLVRCHLVDESHDGDVPCARPAAFWKVDFIKRPFNSGQMYKCTNVIKMYDVHNRSWWSKVGRSEARNSSPALMWPLLSN